MSIELFFNWQPIKGQIKFHLRDLQTPVEKIRQLCSRGVWRLDVPNRVHAPRACSLAEAGLDGLFDHPAGCSDAVPDLLKCCVAPVPNGFFNNLLRTHSLELGGLGVTKRKIQEWGISAGI